MTYSSEFHRSTAMYIFAMGALPAMAGSATTFVLSGMILWGIPSLLFGKIAWRPTPAERIVSWTMAGFAALVLLTALLGHNRSTISDHVYWLIPFLFAWVVLARLRASPDIDHLKLYIFGAGVGALGALASGLFQLTVAGLRPEGAAGNPAVYGIVSLCLAGIAGLHIDSASKSRHILAGAAVLGGIGAVVLSGTRGVIIAVPVVMAMLVLYSPAGWRAFFRPKVLLLIAASTALVLYVSWDFLAVRANFVLKEFSIVAADGYSPNISDRLELWRAGWVAMTEAPILGYGIQNRMAVIAEVLARDGHPALDYTHAHNGFISVAIDGGAVLLAGLFAVLIIPAIAARLAPHDDNYRRRFFLALLVPLIYMICGLSQIMFKHDLMGSVYVFSAIVVASSIPALSAARQEPSTPHQGTPGGGAAIVDSCFAFVEKYLSPLYLAVVVAAGILQSFMSDAAKDSFLAWLWS